MAPRFPRPFKVAGLLTIPLLFPANTGSAEAPEKNAPTPRKRMELAEARRTVRLMNDIYVTGVLTTHEMYVREPGNPAAVSWGKQVIRQINAKGWPDAHIFDLTGRPLNPDNRPLDAFEKEAGVLFKSGKPAAEQIDRRSLRYATSIRITDASCLGCHVRSKVGDLLGGISFRVELVNRER